MTIAAAPVDVTTTSIPEQDLIIDLAPVRDAGWAVKDLNEWVLCEKPGTVLPDVGWKAHVSGTLANAATGIAAARDVALELGLTFKFMPTADRARLINSKGALRTSSGKIACIYAVDAATLERVVEELRVRLRGEDGPDILTDLRCGEEPVFIRYGGFHPLWTFRRGVRVLGLRSPEGGIVPDEGRFRWTLPSWVELPAWAQKYLDQRAGRTLRLPCAIRSSLHFSAAGGVYVGEMRDTGEKVLVKEARPYAGLDEYGDDAVARLHHEHRWLQRLGPAGVVPREFGMHRGSRHHYLVREMLDGETAAATMWRTFPWNACADPVQEDVEAYVAWALDLLDRVADLLYVVHAEGAAVHDLHPGNLFLEDGTGAVKLFDLETLTDVDSCAHPPVIAPEYLRHEGGDGRTRDAYAYRVLAHALFAPTILGWPEENRIVQVRTWITRMFGARVLHEIDRRTEGEAMGRGFTIVGGQPPAPPTIEDLIEGLTARQEAGDLREFVPEDPGLDRGIGGLHLADALHPAHPLPDRDGARRRELEEGLAASKDVDLCLSTGSAGIVLALLASGAEVDLDEWAHATTALLDADVVEHDLQHGSPGVAVTLWAARALAPTWHGGRELAEALARRAATVRPGTVGGVGLLQGDAGLGLFWTLLDRLGVAGAHGRIAQFLAPPPPPGTVTTLPGGLGALGGWLAAWAAAPEDLWAERGRSAVEDVLDRPLFHKSGGLGGVAGTLLGIHLVGARVPEAAEAARARVEPELALWLGGGAGPGLAPYEPGLRRTTDTLESGTTGIVLLDALRQGGGADLW